MSALLKAPFPWFGGKSRIAPEIWQRLGNVQNYVEPFFGSGATLLARPTPFAGVETVNDACGFVANFWRALQADPDGLAQMVDWPVNEADLHARHYWLVTQGRERLEAVLPRPDGFDLQVAGWWCAGLCGHIGSGFCSGTGPWSVGQDGRWRKRDAGRGINRNLPHLGDAGQGINRKLPHLGNAGRGVADWLRALSVRLRRVRVAHGDWSRVCGDSITWGHGLTGVFLDPPYSAEADRTAGVYAADDSDVAHKAAAWAREAGARTDMRIVLAGYEGEHDMPGWTVVPWRAQGGYGNQAEGRGRANAAREVLWCSPACQAGPIADLFEAAS